MFTDILYAFVLTNICVPPIRHIYCDARNVMYETPKGRRDAEDAEVAEQCHRRNTSGMNFALAIALSFEAIWQTSSTSVLAQKSNEMRRRRTRFLKNEAMLRFMHLRGI